MRGSGQYVEDVNAPGLRYNLGLLRQTERMQRLISAISKQSFAHLPQGESYGRVVSRHVDRTRRNTSRPTQSKRTLVDLLGRMNTPIMHIWAGHVQGWMVRSVEPGRQRSTRIDCVLRVQTPAQTLSLYPADGGVNSEIYAGIKIGELYQ